MRPLFSISVLVLSVLVFITPADAQIPFIEPLTSWVAPGSQDGAYGVAVADFNRDGKPDVAFLQVTSGVYHVSVMLGNGGGTFAAPVNVFTFLTNDYSVGTLARDFNGDGKMDIAFTVHQLNEIVVLPGNGDGTFGAPIITSTTLAPDFMQTADVNGDGKLDLVIVDQSSNMVSVLFGKGDGTFQGEVYYALGGTNPQDLAVADVNRDGNPDIVVGDYDSETVNVLLNDGTGKFAPASGSPFSVGMQVLGLEVADFNGDGKPDIATAGFGNCSPGPSTIRVSLGNGDGTFQAPLKEQCISGYAPSRHYSDNQPIDLNGDGKFDIVFGDANNNEIDVGLGNGDGTFTQAVYVASQGPAGAGISFVDGNGVGDVAVADFNGDGMPDLLATEYGRASRQGGISLLLAVRPGAFRAPGVFQAGGTEGYHTIVVGDFNGDGKLDAAVMGGEGNGGGAGILLGNGDGTFGSVTNTPGCNCSGEFYSWLDSASFRANSVLDLLILANDGVQAGPPPRVRNNGDGTLAAPLHPSIGENNPSGIAVGDLNGDGRPDFVVMMGSSSNAMSLAAVLNGGGPAVTLSPTSLSFANQVINTTSTAKTVTLTNTATAALNINSITISGDFAIFSKTCGSNLAAGAKCKVKVTFTPTVLGKLTGTLTFTDNAPNSPQTVSLSGTGVLPATLKPATAKYAAQTVGSTSPPKTFTLTNNQTITLSNIVISTTGDFAVSATTCTTSLGPKSKCTISVTFTPAAKGTRTGVLSVSDSANNSPQTSSLTGTGQ